MKHEIVKGQVWKYFRTMFKGETRTITKIDGDVVDCLDQRGLSVGVIVDFLLENANLICNPSAPEQAPDHSDTIERLIQMKKQLEIAASHKRSISPWGDIETESWEDAYNRELDAKALEIAIDSLKTRSVAE